LKPQDISHKFWFGTHYYRPPTPRPAEWEEDFKRLKDFGLTNIQFRVFWRCYERYENVYTWDDLDRIMDLSGKHGLRGVHQITLENAPQYIFDKYDGYRIDIRGQRIWPVGHAAFYPGGWIPCFDNPEVLKHGLAFVEKLVERYRCHPATELWHAWNEPRSRPMGECACGHSIVSYRNWLKEKFGSIESLNERFGKVWGGFDQVDAARDTSDFAEMYLWRQWATSRVHHRVAAVVETVRKLDPDHAVISHVGMNNMQQDPLPDISDDERMSTVADLYGSSFEIRYTPEPVVHSQPLMVCDWMRHLGHGDYTIYELYPSRGRFEPELPPHQFQQWLWTPVAAGSKTLFLWQFKKERLGMETSDAGLVEIDGRDNPTSLDARKSFKLFEKLGSLINDWKVPLAKIAMVYDLPSDLVNRMELTVTRDGDYVGQYKLRWQLPMGHAYKTAIHGLYHLLWLKNIQTDIVSSRRLGEVAKHYELLYLPSMIVVDEAMAKTLRDFVEQGGKLIVDAGFARRDANSWLHPSWPGNDLTTFLGYREELVTIDPGLRERLRDQNSSLPMGSYERVNLTPISAMPIAWWEDGQVAAVTKTIGRGQILAMGFSPGLSYMIEPNAGWTDYVEKLIVEWAKVASPYWFRDSAEGRLTLRRMIDEQGRQIVFAFRRWGIDTADDEKSWTKWTIPGAEMLFELSYVKCFVVQ
jgi:beta-galactosidase GanA